MKTGVNLTILKGFCSPKEAIRPIAEAGFDSCFWNTEEGVPVREIAAEAAGAGLEMPFIHAPVRGVDSVWKEGEEGDAFIAMLTGWMRQCSENRIPYMVCHVWTGFYPYSPNALGIDRFGRLLSEAEKEGVKIAFENAENGAFLDFVRDQLWDSPAAGYCFDSGHELCYSLGEDQLAKYGHRLLCTHLNDNMGRTGDSITSADDAHMMPFDGTADWPGIAARLKKLDYDGIFTFELKMQNKPGRHTHDRYALLSAEEVLALAQKKAQKFLKLMK